MKNKKICVFTGAGVSQESGISTFRDSGGLWDKYKISEVATPEGWKKDPEKVLNFYNERRKDILNTKPNLAHELIVKLEEKYDVSVITQNIDDLHERAGSSNVLHLHGSIFSYRSTVNPKLKYKKIENVNFGEKCEKGSQLRPDIVWFGEDVPNIREAFSLVANSEILIIIGTSFNVYPAASLFDYIEDKPVYIIDPNLDLNSKDLDDSIKKYSYKNHIKMSATEGMNHLINNYIKI